MAKHFLFFTFVIFLINNSLTNAGYENAVLKSCEECLLKNYEQLLKLIKCEYCNENSNFRGFNNLQKENCVITKEECEELLKNKDALRNLLVNIKPEEFTGNVRTNADNLKELINVVEIQKRDIDMLRKIIDGIQENKTVMLINRDNNATIANLSSQLMNLRNNVDYLQRNHELIQNELATEGQKEIQELQELYKLKKELDDINEGIEKFSNMQNYELGNFNIESLVKNGLQDIIGKGGEELLDTVKKSVITSDDVVTKELVNMLDGKELLDKLINKDSKAAETTASNLDEAVVNQLDQLKTRLTSYEFIMNSIKTIFLSKLKEHLLKALYDAYTSYKKKEAKENGEPEPTFSEQINIEDMKKGIVEIGVKLLLTKLRIFLKFIKGKIFPKQNTKLDINLKNSGNNMNANNIPNNNTGDIYEDVNELQEALPQREVNLLRHIDNIIEEINFYTSKFQDNNEVDIRETQVETEMVNETGEQVNGENVETRDQVNEENLHQVNEENIEQTNEGNVEQVNEGNVENIEQTNEGNEEQVNEETGEQANEVTDQ